MTMIDNKQQVGLTAAFSRNSENKPKYVKSTYVPPHQRNKPTQKSFDQKFTNGGKKSLDYNNSYKPWGLNFYIDSGIVTVGWSRDLNLELRDNGKLM
jgi:hypothetical protein